MADRVIKHCGRPMLHVGRGLFECGDCGVVLTEKEVTGG